MKKHVLLADYDKDELKFFIAARDMFRIDYKCTWAQSGEQAIEQLHYLCPDLVFLDMNMPGINDFDTLARIRRLPGKENVPVVMHLTGLREADAQKANALGAAAVSGSRRPYTILWRN